MTSFFEYFYENVKLFSHICMRGRECINNLYKFPKYKY